MRIDKRFAVCAATLLVFVSAARAADVPEHFTLRVAPEVSVGEAQPSAGAFQDAGEVAGDGTKSGTKAALYSLLLPGLGQHYVGNKKGARLFLGIEAVIWASFAVFQVQGHQREDGYQEYAQVFAGVVSKDHSDDFYALLTEFDTWKQYEDDIKSEGRLNFYPNVDTDMLERYWVENRISDFEEWVWQSADVRRAYQDQRAASKKAYRRSTYAVAAAIANRVASSFFAIKDARDYNERLAGDKQSLHIEFGPRSYEPDGGFQTGLSVVRKF
jgi:hypothetical protein